MKVPRAALLVALGTAPACLVGEPAPYPTPIEDTGADATSDTAADAATDAAADAESDADAPESDADATETDTPQAPGEDASSKFSDGDDASRLAAVPPPSGPLSA